MGYIYMLIDKRNGKKYVGKHNGNKTEYWSSGIVPNRIAKKHGRNIFDRIILEDNIEDLKKLNEREKFYISEHDSFNNGYNSTIGGEGGGHWIYLKSDEEKLVIFNKKSEKLKGRVFSEETKKKLSEQKKGIKNPNHSNFMIENNPNHIKISIEGVVYDSIVGASKELNISKHTIRGRLNNKSEKFKNWIRIL
jgi:group I intron endonuclease